MTSISSLGYEQEINNQRYLKCLVEGMKDWVEVKAKSGNKGISQYQNEIKKEIKPYPNLTSNILEKMKVLGIDKDILNEFKGIFNNKLIIML